MTRCCSLQVPSSSLFLYPLPLSHLSHIQNGHKLEFYNQITFLFIAHNIYQVHSQPTRSKIILTLTFLSRWFAGDPLLLPLIATFAVNCLNPYVVSFKVIILHSNCLSIRLICNLDTTHSLCSSSRALPYHPSSLSAGIKKNS